MPHTSSSLHNADDHEQPGPSSGSGEIQTQLCEPSWPVCTGLSATASRVFTPQFPQELVTYGGNGQVFSNWAQVGTDVASAVLCAVTVRV